MKKVSIVLLFVAIMVLSMTGCAFAPAEVVASAPAEVVGSGTLRYEVRGTFNTSKISKESVVYRFDAPNNGIVVYQMPGTVFLVGENIDRDGIDYAANMYIKDGEFVALSDKYLLFATAGSKGMVAVPIGVESESAVCEGLLIEYSFDDLTEAEKDAFVYPSERNVVTR